MTTLVRYFLTYIFAFSFIHELDGLQEIMLVHQVLVKIKTRTFDGYTFIHLKFTVGYKKK